MRTIYTFTSFFLTHAMCKKHLILNIDVCRKFLMEHLGPGYQDLWLVATWAACKLMKRSHNFFGYAAANEVLLTYI